VIVPSPCSRARAGWSNSGSLKPCGCSDVGSSFMRSMTLTTRNLRKCCLGMETAASVSLARNDDVDVVPGLQAVIDTK
jgi:hypothetical protein